MGKVRVAILGVGNCASSLVQGVEFYRRTPDNVPVPGLTRTVLGGYHVNDVEFTFGIDVNADKVGKDLSEAISVRPNNTVSFCPVPATGARVFPGRVLDGVGKYTHGLFPLVQVPSADVRQLLQDTHTDVLVNYLPVGSEHATAHYLEEALEAKVAVVNCIPVFVASNPYWQDRFRRSGVPVLGDDVKSQFGATILHRVLAELMVSRGLRIERTYQLNFGGNTDFLNMLERERLASKKKSKTDAVTSMIPQVMDRDNVHVGPSDHVPWLEDRKWCHVHVEATGFGGQPVRLEAKLEVWDSPNSAGVVIDAVRCAKIALDRGLPGPVEPASCHFFKSPPRQLPEAECLRLLEEFCRG